MNDQKPSSSPLQNSDFDTIPENWIEYYATDITPSIDQSGILVQTMTTINDDNARGEIAYSRGMLSKISMEYELSMPLYAGLFLLIGGVVGGSFTPEVDFSKSSSTYCTCPVIAGRTAQLRVFPIRVTLTPHSKKMKWNRKLQKLATKLNTFKKDKKFTLLFLTGLEDVECRYI
ncbi:hypothetical protein KGF56_000966 [Candida oxycetoniae]|uniref:Uncharacterized protein n=1 Tax=Candida oxycetoniae TaxID=497107 RepID=A0AAI9T026_9ASCO|nr:uncharacterized protein KGF56_000966 [Candida oxycetoniae]KAI3406124.2 hypothetical protein KGF56_000966 [Candida oxycetoniae]